MKRVYSSQNTMMVDHMKLLVEAQNIACTVRNRTLSSLAGEIPFTETWPALWVLNDDQADDAKLIVDHALHDMEHKTEPWQCPKCQTTIEGQFSECWKCAGNN